MLTPTDGILVVDDSTLDKPYARHIDLVTRHWSGKHHAVVRGKHPDDDSVQSRVAARLPAGELDGKLLKAPE